VLPLITIKFACLYVRFHQQAFFLLKLGIWQDQSPLKVKIGQAMGEDYGLDVTCVWGETGSTAVDAKKMGEGGEELKKREEGPSKAGGGGGGDAGAGAGGREARPAQKGG